MLSASSHPQSLSVSSAETGELRVDIYPDNVRFNPYRVFSSAETRSSSHRSSNATCFNPYRVFSSAETIFPLHTGQLSVCFNPYRVFSSAETRFGLGYPKGNNDVSIPIGFSHQLRLFCSARHRVSTEGFNPYRVFSSAETQRARGRRRRPDVSIPIGFSHQLRPVRRRSPGERARFQSLSGFLIS